MIQIHPDTPFSTGDAARMINKPGLSASRIKILCEKGLVPHTKGGDGRSHYRIKFKDFDQILVAHQQVRTVNRGPKYVTPEQYDQLADRVAMLEEILNTMLLDARSSKEEE